MDIEKRPGQSKDSVEAILRTSDELRVILEATALTEVQLQNPTEDIGSLLSQRILAVVTHRSLGNPEEGSLFVCQPGAKYTTRDEAERFEVKVLRTIPITVEFSITMAQMRRGTIDLRPGVPITAPSKIRSGFSLTINTADTEPLYFFAHDVHALKAVVSECRRVKEVFASTEEDFTAVNPLTERFSWLAPYDPQQDTPYETPKAPLDLRISGKSVHERLSPATAGLPGDDESDVLVIQDDWIASKARETCKTGRYELNVRIGTFNVNGNIPSQDLSSWIQGITSLLETPEEGSNDIGEEKDEPTLPTSASASKKGGPPTSLSQALPSDSQEFINQTETTSLDQQSPDIIVLGFQELDLSTEALLYSTSTFREEAWTTGIFAALGEKAVQYEKLASRQLVGMLIIVIVKRSLSSHFADIKTSSAGAGILGMLGNKGGTAVRLTFTPPASKGVENPAPTTFTFVNAHLAAFDEQYEKRNSDFQDLSKRLTFESDEFFQDDGSPERMTVYESDVLIWLGDLNYRVDLPDGEVRNILRATGWDHRVNALMKFDQLRKAQSAKKAFHGFLEHPISHNPTYRFSPGVLTDEMGYDLKRKPAWTDRILYMNSPNVILQQRSYSAYPLLTMSDHRPVAADFVIGVDVYDKNQYDSTVRRLLRDVGKWDHHEEQYKLEISMSSIDFGLLSFQKDTIRTAEIKNVGKVPCAFRWLSAEDQTPIYPAWLRLEPMTGLLLPNQSVTVTLTAHVDNKVAEKLNLGPRRLEWTLILHSLLGKDQFIELTGEYEYTCFGNSLSRLTRISGPIRSLQSASDLLPEAQARNAPKEVMRLVNWMMGKAEHNDGLFLLPGESGTIATIRECLDTGAEFPFAQDTSDPMVSLSFASTLLQLLDSLTEPVVPASLHAKCIQMTNRDEAFEMLDMFPPASVNVWISVTAFLHYICQSEQKKATKIANVFAPILLREGTDPSQVPISPLRKRDFVLHFLL